jgi:MFS family permease
LGALLLSVWLVALLLGISESSSWGWTSSRIIGLFAFAAIVATVWVVFESRKREPLVDMQMMRLRGVWTTNTCALLIGFGLFGGWILIPQLVELPESTGFGFGASITQAGIYLLPGTIGMLVFSPVAGRLATTVGPKVPLAIGSLTSTAAFVLLALGHDQSWQIYLGMGLMGVGIGLAFSAMANLIVEAVPPRQTGVATGMHTIVRTVGNAFGSQASATIVASSVALSGLPLERGFTIAFAVYAVVLLLAFLVTFLIPPREIRVLASTPALRPAD